MFKIGRNSICPCGSGKKYKKCCLVQEDDMSFMDPDLFINGFKELKHQAKIKQCLHPDKANCSEKIISAHSIQNNKILKNISDNGNVYMPYPKNDNPFATMTEWGRREATVFTGFCGYHDNELFKPIENYDFNYSNEHIFLFTYRSFALGYHRKQENLKFQQKIIGKRPSVIASGVFNELLAGPQLAVNDLEYEKKCFDKAILNKKYDVLTSVVWEFSKPINFAASGYTALCYDFKGNVIQDINNFDVPLKHLFINVFPDTNVSYCILSWISEKNDIFNEYKNQLLKLTDDEKIIYLNNLIPMEVDNIVINPTSWDQLAGNQKEEFGAFIWGLGEISEMLSDEKVNMLEETSFNLFEL